MNTTQSEIFAPVDEADDFGAEAWPDHEDVVDESSWHGEDDADWEDYPAEEVYSDEEGMFGEVISDEGYPAMEYAEDGYDETDEDAVAPMLGELDTYHQSRRAPRAANLPSALAARIAHIAEQEYQRWRPGGGKSLVETDRAATPILQDYYRTGVGLIVSAHQLKSTQWQQGHPWSAVFISWVMKKAGAGPAFTYSPAHQNYIRAARRNRLEGNTANPFWAFRVTEIAPQIGDLVCTAREHSGATYDNIAGQSRKTHCDIVTAVRPGEIRVIGGNVRQNVDAKTLRTGPDGTLRTDGKQSGYFAIIRCNDATVPAPVPPQPAPRPGPGPAPNVRAHIHVVRNFPLLRDHAGTPPDLVLKWNDMAQPASVDVVVHLHGWSGAGARMNILRNKLPASGLDFADPKNPASVGRTAPTLMILPRGHHDPVGGKTERYTFPALIRPGALQRLIDESLAIFAAQTGVPVRRNRLILTAHSGGGAPLMKILGHTDPDEVHTFDALYTDPAPLISWAERRMASGSGALRVIYRPGEGTAANSKRVAHAVAAKGLPNFRVEHTSVSHNDIPGRFGWRLLANPSTELPGVGLTREAADEYEFEPNEYENSEEADEADIACSEFAESDDEWSAEVDHEDILDEDHAEEASVHDSYGDEQHSAEESAEWDEDLADEMDESPDAWEYPQEVSEVIDASECECEECSGCGGQHAEVDEVAEVTTVPAGSRPPIRSTATLRNAWREYRCATGRMVTARLFGKWNTPVNPKTVDAWRALEKTLAAAGYDVHRAWVYVCRNIAGQKAASLHAYGLAIDIDHAGPRCNVNNPTPDRRPVRFSEAPTKSERCRDVQQGKADTAFTPEQIAAVEAIRTVDGHQVFAWGGRWPTTKDTMHFQINVTPAELARGIVPETVGRNSGANEFADFEESFDEFWPDRLEESDSEWDEYDENADGPFRPERTSEETWDTVGSIFGGVAGGLLGGPVGAVAGGLAGRAWGAAADRASTTAIAPVPTPTPAPTPVQPDTRPVGTVAVPAECVAIPTLVKPSNPCPVGADTPTTRPLRMPSPGIGRFEANPMITAFVADLANCFATRKGKTDIERARLVTQKADELAKDYAATLTAGLVRYGPTWQKRAETAVQKREKELRRRNGGQLAAGDLAVLERERCDQEVWLAGRMNWLRTGWMIGRREQVDFDTLMPPSIPGQANFNPPPIAAGTRPSLVAIEPEGTGTPISKETKAFLAQLRRQVSGFDANNYSGHGGGKFAGRGFSLDLTLRDPLDSRGFYPRDKAAAFLLQVDAAARAVGLRWRVLYNDFAVAAHVNRLKRARHVVFIGSAGRNLNWHGPLVLHFHLDLAPLSGIAASESEATDTWSETGDNTVTFEDSPAVHPGQLEHQLLQHVQASWQRVNLTAPSATQLGRMRAGKKGYKRYISNGLYVDDVAVALRRANLLSISDDDIDMLQRASNVETGGRLTALNSWDSAFMSVGFMQWTIKYTKLQQWIALAPQAFRRYGIELERTRRYVFSPSHSERAIVGAPRPGDLRSREWGVRFYLASLDLDAIVAEYRRALQVSTEVRRAIVDPHGAAVVAHYNASPVLRALIQETHNNRPAYMRQAMKNAASRAGTDTPGFLNLVRKEIVRVYTEREDAPGKAVNLIKKTQQLRV